jgi:hypothetical protein
MGIETITVALASAGVGSLTLFLVWINWQILKISQHILEVSIELLAETITIRVETIKIRKISYKVLDETIRMRKALGDSNSSHPEPLSFAKKDATRKNT